MLLYHGSQQDNIQEFHELLYLTSNKENAINYAKGYCFGYDLQKSDKPTLYTFDIDINKLNLLKCDIDEVGMFDKGKEHAITWLDYGDITNYYDKEFKKKMFNKYDGVIYEDIIVLFKGYKPINKEKI